MCENLKRLTFVHKTARRLQLANKDRNHRSLATIQSRASPLIPNPIKKMAIQLKRQRRTGSASARAAWVRSKVFINEKVPGARVSDLAPA